MKPSVYVETSVISYLAAKPSRDIIIAARQQVTHEWWDRRRNDFDLFVSELVIAEAAAGDSEAAARRIAVLKELPVIGITPLAEELADGILQRANLPPRARADALHIAIATSQGLDYLMTWNVTHLANALIRPRVEQACRLVGYEPPVLCTPDELVAGEEHHV
jgi:hypothetical protein